jgi:integrase
VFTTDVGRPVNPRNLLRVIEVAARTAGVAGVGVHTLRHSAAVARLESGVHIKAVADLLGHSSIAITGDVYGHTSDDTARPLSMRWPAASGCERRRAVVNTSWLGYEMERHFREVG